MDGLSCQDSGVRISNHQGGLWSSSLPWASGSWWVHWESETWRLRCETSFHSCSYKPLEPGKHQTSFWINRYSFLSTRKRQVSWLSSVTDLKRCGWSDWCPPEVEKNPNQLHFRDKMRPSLNEEQRTIFSTKQNEIYKLHPSISFGPHD